MSIHKRIAGGNAADSAAANDAKAAVTQRGEDRVLTGSNSYEDQGLENRAGNLDGQHGT